MRPPTESSKTRHSLWPSCVQEVDMIQLEKFPPAVGPETYWLAEVALHSPALGVVTFSLNG